MSITDQAAAEVRRPTSSRRLLTEAFGATPGVVAVTQLAWLIRWLFEQRW